MDLELSLPAKNVANKNEGIKLFFYLSSGLIWFSKVKINITLLSEDKYDQSLQKSINQISSSTD